jgi:hypothetical protein
MSQNPRFMQYIAAIYVTYIGVVIWNSPAPYCAPAILQCVLDERIVTVRAQNGHEMTRSSS